MKLSDYVVSYLENKGVSHVFGVTGGGAMHLNDSLGKSKKINFIMTHHEQAAAMASEAYSRETNKIGVCQVTTGPGGTNAVTGVTGAWIDSIPMIVISGQVGSKDMINNLKIRQRGVQEINIIDIVKPITKYAKTILDENKIKYELDKCFYYSKSGRPGPVWLDIPLDIQAKKIKHKSLVSFKAKKKSLERKIDYKKILNLINNAKRPSIVIGNGVHLSKSHKELVKLTNYLKIPILSSWNASDILPSKREYVGRFGIFGDRASNFCVQNSDLLLVLGSRLSQPQTGYNMNIFAPDAKIIFVDIDINESNKFNGEGNIYIKKDLKEFMSKFISFLKKKQTHIKKHESWNNTNLKWKKNYPVVLKKYKKEKKINSFYFINELAKITKSNTSIVTDMGTSFTCTMQTFKCKPNQRLYTSSGLAAMGFGLPGSIGAAFGSKNREIICIAGDGGFMFNIQELQTVLYYKLPIKIFVLCNNGYLTMKLMQKKNFKNLIGSSPTTGLSWPDFDKVAKSFGLKTYTLNNTKQFDKNFKKIFNSNRSFLCQIQMSDFQKLIPRLQTKMSSEGKFLPTPIDNLYPFLPEQEYKKNIFYSKKVI